jgi:hypothetical protein
MAKGTLVFEFESALDLENQMRAYLRLPQLQEITLGEAEQPANMARGVLGKLGDGMTFSVSSEERVEAAQHGVEATEFNASPMVGRTASGIPEEVRKGNQETAAAAVAAATQAAEPVKEALKDMVGATPTPEQNTPAITLETLANAPYPELLAFCKSNPGVGLDVSKCQHEYFRKYVETKVKTYLETE